MAQIVLKAIPTFRILDYKKAINFYVDGLGFNMDWEHRFGPTEPVYLQISLNGLTLHLTENERFAPGVIVFVDAKELMKFYNELRHDKIEVPKPEKTNWQTIQMEVKDPFGNLLRFNENISE
jgi:uncharacterized glyoxalase superfamily protein PhnB